MNEVEMSSGAFLSSVRGVRSRDVGTGNVQAKQAKSPEYQCLIVWMGVWQH